MILIAYHIVTAIHFTNELMIMWCVNYLSSLVRNLQEHWISWQVRLLLDYQWSLSVGWLTLDQSCGDIYNNYILKLVIMINQDIIVLIMMAITGDNFILMCAGVSGGWWRIANVDTSRGDTVIVRVNSVKVLILVQASVMLEMMTLTLCSSSLLTEKVTKVEKEDIWRSFHITTGHIV